MARRVLASEEAWGLLNSVQKRVGGATSPGPTATSVSRLRIATGLLGRCSRFRIPGTGRARAKAFCARQARVRVRRSRQGQRVSDGRSEERREGKKGVSTGSYWGWE